jgi:hypothetical protein
MTDAITHQTPEPRDARAALARNAVKFELLDRRAEAVEIFGRAMSAAQEVRSGIIAAGKWDKGYCGGCWVEIDQNTDIEQQFAKVVKFLEQHSYKHEGRLRFGLPRVLRQTQSLDDNEALADAFVDVLKAAGVSAHRISYSD